MDRKEYLREYHKKWKADNRQRIQAMERARYHAQTAEQKAESVAKNKAYRRRIRLETLQHYGGKCACCGETISEFLCFDHIENNGAAHRKNMVDRSIAPWLKRNNYPKGFQVLCHNCNIGKGVNGKCPHQK